MKRKIILGGGISALAFAFYNPDASVLCDKLSLEDSPFNLLQKTHSTEKLLSDIGFGYISDLMHVATINKKDTLERKVGNSESYYKGTDRIGWIGRNFKMEVLNCKTSDIVKHLYQKIKDRVTFCNIKKIYPDFVETDKGKFFYDELVSTLHCKKFEELHTSWKVSGVEVLKSYFSVSKYDGEESETVYFDKGIVSKTVYNAFCGLAGSEHPVKVKGSKESLSRFKGVLNAPPDKTIFVGRFATANSHYRIEDSVFVAQEGYLLAKMLAEQKRFDNCIAKEKGIDEQEMQKGLILHAHSELSELLREINWKMNEAETKKVRATSVLEEGIDVIKLIMAILHRYNYTEREIADMFFKKSDKVWSKFIESYYGGV